MQNKYLLIENKGEMDVNALILMGGSTKRDSTTAIGFFGSGNKYAIALMLRKNIPFRIFSGEKEWKIETKAVTFRDKNFEQILVNGMETSLTTDMGPQWDSWMGVREWVSNSIDEGEHNIMNSATEIRPREGYTRIYVEHNSQIQDVIDNWNAYFSFDRLDCIFNHLGDKIFPQIFHEKQKALFYRKGIQCYISNSRAMYNYDLKDFDINESRVLQDTWRGKRQIARFLTATTSKEVAHNILSNAFVGEIQFMESGLEYYDMMPHGGLCAAWREAIGNRIIVNNNVSGFYETELNSNPHFRVSTQMAKAIKRSFDDVPVYGIGQDGDDSPNWKDAEITPKIQYLMQRALDFCKETEYVLHYPIKVVEFDQPTVLGTIDRRSKTLLVSTKAFDMGIKEVVMTIMEEQIHLHENLKDQTRDFEQYLIRQWLSEKELRFGIFL